MIQPRRLLQLGLGLLLLAIVIIFVLQREPAYKDRRCSEWIMDLDDQKPGPAHQAATEAVHAMGIKAMPTILKMLRTREPWWEKKFRELVGKQSLIKFKFIPLDEGHRHTVLACYELGPKAKEAIPSLIALLESGFTRGYVGAALSQIGPEFVGPVTQALVSSNEMVRCEILHSLGNMQSYSTNNWTQASNAITAVVKSLDDKDSHVRLAAVVALRNLIDQHPKKLEVDTTNIIPKLMTLMTDESVDVERFACLTLGRFEEKAKGAVSELEKIFHGDREVLRGAAALALLQIDPTKEDELMPTLLKNLDDPRHYRYDTMQALYLCRQHTNVTVPLLTRIIRDKKMPGYEREIARESLHKIDAKAADKAAETFNLDAMGVERSE